MKKPRVFFGKRSDRWRWLRQVRGINQSTVACYLRAMGCKVSKNTISNLESNPHHKLDQETIACLSFIYNNDGNPANITWIINGLDDPFTYF